MRGSQENEIQPKTKIYVDSLDGILYKKTAFFCFVCVIFVGAVMTKKIKIKSEFPLVILELGFPDCNLPIFTYIHLYSHVYIYI